MPTNLINKGISAFFIQFDDKFELVLPTVNFENSAAWFDGNQENSSNCIIIRQCFDEENSIMSVVFSCVALILRNMHAQNQKWAILVALLAISFSKNQVRKHQILF